MTSTREWLHAIGAGLMVSGTLASAPFVTAAQLPDATTSREIVSAIGCVQQATAAEASAGGQHTDGAFVLRGARVGSSSPRTERPAIPPTSPGTPANNEGSEATNTAEPGSGAPPAEARASGNDMASPRPRDGGLVLIADRGVDLAAHVGHQVMVTGPLSSFAAAGGVASTSSGRAMTVTKVVFVAPACTPGS
jgi:hypothetical protein